MKEEKVCRVLIVDNELDYAAETAAKLKEIRPSLLNNNPLQIELTNNAYFAAARLRECPVDQPPWDVIISDVYMPCPASSDQQLAGSNAVLSEYAYQGESWRCWTYSYPDGELEEKIEHGGFRIAETIAERLAAGEEMADLKMILMSNVLFDEARNRILAYQSRNSGWLKYYDKADWQRPNLSSWPAMQLEPNVFKFALIRAVTDRTTKHWEDMIYDIIPDVQAYIGTTSTAELEWIITEAQRLGKETEVETILITGEIGTGREVFAELIHKLRMRALNGQGALVKLDCSAIPDHAFPQELFDCVEESAGGTLFIDEIDKLSAPQQGLLYHLFRDKRIRSIDRIQTVDFAARLAICTASDSNLEDLKNDGHFHADLYFLLKDERLHLGPLRERPGDALSIAEQLSEQRGLMLSDCAKEWIETYQWPGNNIELRNVINAAKRRASTRELVAGDFESLVKGGRGKTRISETETIPEVKNFRAEPPFQLHWGDSLLIDRQKRPIPLEDDLYRVLKELLRTEEGQHGFIRGRLTFAEIANVYKGSGGYNEEHTEAIARQFVRNLRRFLESYGVDHQGLIRTWKSHGYKLGVHWERPPVIYASEPSLVFTEDLEKAERGQREKLTGRRKKLSPEF